MYYGIYRNIRDSAWQCLIDFDVKSLPVNVSAIARAAGIHVIKNSYVNELKPNEYGRSFYDGETWIIVYNDMQDPVISRFTLAHELGHFFLGHAVTCAKYVHAKDFDKKPKAEKHADAFAMRLLCPACVLHALELTTAEEIAATCRIPLDVAALRTTRIRELNKRNKFLSHPLEQEVYKNFESYLATRSKFLSKEDQA